MNLYEGMFIFPDRLKEEEIDGVLKIARGEIERLGGVVVSATRLGRRAFARPIRKTNNGHYAVVSFECGPDKIPSLHARFKLNEDVLRVQFVRAQAEPAADAAERE